MKSDQVLIQIAVAQPGVSIMDEILEEAADDAQAAVESAQRHSREDTVNVGLVHPLHPLQTLAQLQTRL